jgi:hypothetical protein
MGGDWDLLEGILSLDYKDFVLLSLQNKPAGNKWTGAQN